MMKRQKPPLAINIARRRRALGYRSALAFSEKIGIPYGTLRDIEAGYSEGWPETKVAIAKALGCTVADLYASPDGRPHYPKTIDVPDFSSAAIFLQKYSKLRQDLRIVVCAIVFDDDKLLSQVPQALRNALKARIP